MNHAWIGAGAVIGLVAVALGVVSAQNGRTARAFPPDFPGDAFVAMRGSWNRKPPTGYKVVRIRFERGKPVRVEDFLTGFLVEDGRAHFGRLAGLAVAKEGALLVSDDTNGVIDRVAYSRTARR